MKTIEITREQANKQLEIDTQMEKELCDRFYSVRVSQTKNILKNGHGIYSIFRNEEAEIIIK